MQARYRKNFYVRSNEKPACPNCDSPLKVVGSRKRKVYEADGSRRQLIIRRLYCTNCRCIHHELPDIITPRKRYSTDTIEQVLSEKSQDFFPGEGSTMIRIHFWFSLLRNYIERTLEALRQIYKEDRDLTIRISSLLPLSPSALPAGWLKQVVRILVNSGRWRQTRNA